MSFPSVVLYLNDIEDIQAAIKDSIGQATFHFADGEYTYDSLEELTRQRGETGIKYLSIAASGDNSSDVRMKIGSPPEYPGMPSRLDMFSLEPRQEALLYRSIQNIFRVRTRWFAALAGYQKHFSIAAQVMIGLAGFLGPIILGIALDFNYLSAAISVLCLSPFFLFGLSFWASMGWFTRVYLFYPHRKPVPFIRRNIGAIALAAVAALVTAMVTWGVTHWLDRVASGQPPKPVSQERDKTPVKEK